MIIYFKKMYIYMVRFMILLRHHNNCTAGCLNKEVTVNRVLQRIHDPHNLQFSLISDFFFT